MSPLGPRTAQIVQTAAELFAERGYDATSLQDIADAAGIRKSSLYAHVAHKEQFLQIICEDYMDRAIDNAQAVYASDTKAIDKLRELVRFLFGSIEQYRAHVTVFLQEMRHLDNDGFQEIRRKRDGWERLLVAIFRDGIAAGELRPFEPRVVAFLFVGMVQWAYRWYSPAGPLSVNELTDIAVDLFARGIVV
jgi:AcrR family transcriptional regulator